MRLQHRNDAAMRDLIERFLLGLLGACAVTVFAGAIAIIVTMDASSASQGGRYYVAVAAIAALGFLDTQIQKVLERRIAFSFTTTSQERRYALVGFVILIAAGAVLIGVAWKLTHGS